MSELCGCPICGSPIEKSFYFDRDIWVCINDMCEWSADVEVEGE